MEREPEVLPGIDGRRSIMLPTISATTGAGATDMSTRPPLPGGACALNGAMRVDGEATGGRHAVLGGRWMPVLDMTEEVVRGRGRGKECLLAALASDRLLVLGEGRGGGCAKRPSSDLLSPFICC